MAFSLALLGASTYEVPVAAGSYDLLATEILTTSQSSVTFASLGDYAADYQHLQIRHSARSNNSAPWEETHLVLNGSSGAYKTHAVFGYHSATPLAFSASYSYIKLVMTAVGNTGVAGAFGLGITDIFDAFDTSKNTTTRTLGGRNPVNNNEDRIALSSGLWVNTDAITSLRLSPEAGSLWLANSRFSLYGIRKGAA